MSWHAWGLLARTHGGGAAPLPHPPCTRHAAAVHAILNCGFSELCIVAPRQKGSIGDFF